MQQNTMGIDWESNLAGYGSLCVLLSDRRTAMAYGLGEKLENRLSYILVPKRAKRHSNKWAKAIKHRVERRRMKADIEAVPCYNRHHGYEW